MSDDINYIEAIAEVMEFNEINEFLNDAEVEAALARVLKVIAKPDIPLNVVLPLLVELQAYATKFQIQAKYWMILSDNSAEAKKKKNLYLTFSDSISKLVDALKYMRK